MTPVIQFVTMPNMRNIINISIPASMKAEIKEEVKKGHYASTSEFFRDLIRSWKKAQLLEDIKKSREEFLAGKAKRFTSFKDLE